jgi:trehalose-6-phosphatase
MVDFCLALGDGRTDEAVFKLLQGQMGNNYVTATVGHKARAPSPRPLQHTHTHTHTRIPSHPAVLMWRCK